MFRKVVSRRARVVFDENDIETIEELERRAGAAARRDGCPHDPVGPCLGQPPGRGSATPLPPRSGMILCHFSLGSGVFSRHFTHHPSVV